MAIGIVVDDAIVVLENIERLIATGLDPRTATIKAMEEITGLVLAITLVLSSAFLPCCFLGGVSGQSFRQFAVTIAVSTVISAINAITMTPSRAVSIFKTEKGHAHRREALPWWIFGVLGGLFTVWLGQQCQRDQPRLAVRNAQGVRPTAWPPIACRCHRGGVERALPSRGARGLRIGVRRAADWTVWSATSSTRCKVARMQELAEQELPRTMAAEWTELAFLQLQAANTAMYFFVLVVVFVFLVLAAQYESWKLPLAVILVVLMCLLCSLVGLQIARMEVTIFTQIGFVVLVGLASKNAILIVEFAKQRQEVGVSRWQATLEACRLLLRPIIMTSFVFIFGVVPLVIAEGAGAEMRRSLGIAVFAGMLGVTLFGIFLTPVFFYVLQWFGRKKEVVPQPIFPKAPSPATLASSDGFWQASVQQVEEALKALQQVSEDDNALQRAADSLQIALKKLHEQTNSAVHPPAK